MELGGVMDNKIRKIRVLEGIVMLENGIDPYTYYLSIGWVIACNYYGISPLGGNILFLNGIDESDATHGFKYSDSPHDLKTMLHNWKLFYELIKDLK